MEMNRNKVYRTVMAKLLELKDTVRGRAFPQMVRTKQITAYHCGPAVLVSLFSFLGIKTSQKSIVASLRAQNKIKQFGLNMKDLGRAAAFTGKGAFVFWKKSGGKMTDLDIIINKRKYPVGVEWQGVFYEDEDEDNGHYSIVTAIDKTKGHLRIADSYPKFAGVDRGFRIRDFIERWWDSNEISIAGTTRKRTVVDSHMMFVITPKGETWPKKLGMAKAS